MMFNILCRGTVSSPCFVSQHKQSDSFCVVSQPVSSQILPGLPNFFINRSAETHPSLFSLFFLKAFWLQNFKPNLLNNYHYADAPKSFVRFCVETRPLLTQIDFFTLLNAFGLQTFKPNLWNNYLRNLRCRTQIFGRFCVETRPLLTQIDFFTLLNAFVLQTFKPNLWNNYLRNLRCRTPIFGRFCVETRLLTQIDFLTLLNAFGLQTFKPNLWNNYLRNLRCRTQIFGRFCVETRPLLTQIDFLTLLTVMHLGCKPGSRTLKTDRWQAS